MGIGELLACPAAVGAPQGLVARQPLHRVALAVSDCACCVPVKSSNTWEGPAVLPRGESNLPVSPPQHLLHLLMRQK